MACAITRVVLRVLLRVVVACKVIFSSGNNQKLFVSLDALRKSGRWDGSSCSRSTPSDRRAGFERNDPYILPRYVIISDFKGSPPCKCTSPLTERWFYTLSVRCRLAEVGQAVGNRKTLSKVEGAFTLI